MSFKNQTGTNTTAGIRRQGLAELVFISIMTTLPCCFCLFINGIMLFTLRSKAEFLETSRFLLLFNLLFADTVLLAHSQAMFLMSSARVKLLDAVCAAVTALHTLPYGVSLLTLVIMCLERYVAVCYPLRHAAIITIRNTRVVICLLWTLSSLNCLIKLSLVLEVRYEDWQHLHMTDLCGRNSVYKDPVSQLYGKASTYSLLVLAGAAVTFSYFGIIVAAKSASTDKASATKARKTLLLHLVQLGLSIFSTLYGSLLIAISKNLDRISAVNIQTFIYICFFVAPKCLGSLIYGLRDQTIRPVLMLHLSCRVLSIQKPHRAAKSFSCKKECMTRWKCKRLPSPALPFAHAQKAVRPHFFCIRVTSVCMT